MTVVEKKIVVLGAGESGVGAAVLAASRGYQVFVSDSGSIKADYKKELANHAIRFEEGTHTYAMFYNAHLAIKSPGIPDHTEAVQFFKTQGIKVISEIEFAATHTNAKKICITGTNGKTTTTMLTYHILKNAGLNVGLAGNVGHSFARQVAQNNYDYYVIELSSFQLDGMFDFKAEIAVLLNITPDHLDRYEYQFQNYINSKFRILNNQTGDDAFVYCADDEIIIQELQKRKPAAKLYPFSIQSKANMAAYIDNDQINIITNSNPFTMSIFEIALKGKHNLYNSMAASISARLLDIRKEMVRDSLMDFKGVEHRLEFVSTIYGIDFINDSKATNVNSAWYALESMTKPVVWIAGGQDKGNDYSMIEDLVKQKVKAVVCLGKDNKKLHKHFGKIITDITDADNAVDAVRIAFSKAKKGDVVLLSPACASFDIFKNYEDRGAQFKSAVRSL